VTDLDLIKSLANGKVLKPSVRIETITPAKAERILEESNTHNRALRGDRVTALAGNIDRDEWKLTGAAIVFDVDGVLLDGQHRLAACAAGTKPIQVIVLRNAERESQDVMDDTLARRLGDALKLRGETDVNRLAAGINWYARLVYIEITGSPHYNTKAVRPSIPQLLQFFTDHPGLRDAMKDAYPVQRALKLRPGPTIGLWYRLGLVDEEHRDVFFNQLKTGANLPEESPILALRRYCENEMSSRFRQKGPDWKWVAVVVKAWNAWREDRPVKLLQYTYGPLNKEQWPIPA
jgi:hypothetical protein